MPGTICVAVLVGFAMSLNFLRKITVRRRSWCLPFESCRFPRIITIHFLAISDAPKEINNMPICDILILINSFKNELDDKDISNYVKKHDNIIQLWPT